jgi:hypothetical protein
MTGLLYSRYVLLGAMLALGVAFLWLVRTDRG